MENIIRTIELFNGVAFLILLIIALRYTRKFRACIKSTWNYKLCSMILSLIQSFIIVAGTIYEAGSSLVWMFSEIGTILLTVAGMGGLLLLFYRLNLFILSGAIYSVDCKKIPLIEKLFKKIPSRKLPLLKMFLYLSLLRVVYLFIYYPGNIDSDCSNTIGAFFRAYTPYSSILGDISISNHIPIVHTFLYGGFMYMGDCIGNQNLGIFLLVLLQTILINVALLLLLQKLYETGCIKVTNLLLLFFCLMPIYSLWSVELVKDQLYSGILLYYVWQLWIICDSEGTYLKNWKHFLLHTFIVFMICTMKNQGVYVVAICGLFAMINYKRTAVYTICSYAVALCVYIFFYTGVLFSFLDIKPVGKQEAMGFMYQQTARYVKNYADEVTEEEKSIIDKVIPYNILAERYNPIMQDDVKFCCREFNGQTVTEEAYCDYKKTWREMGLKKPVVYLESILNNCYGFFFPFHIYERMFHQSKNNLRICIENPDVFKYHQIKWLYPIQRGLKYAMPIMSAVPIVGLLFGFPIYSWFLFIAIFWMIAGGRWKECLIWMPAVVSVGVLLVSPANEVYRYIEPVVFIAPFAIVYAYNTCKTGKSQDELC